MDKHNKVNLKGSFLNFSNDLNNLLIGIQGFARLLDSELEVKEEAKRHLTKLIELTERATDLNKNFSVYLENSVASSNQLTTKIKKRNLKIKHRAPKVLIIDDEESVCQVLSHQLQSAGYRVVSVNDSSKALEIFEEELFDCVVLDLTMPLMSGNLVFARLKATDPDIPVILMSGYITEQRLKEYSNVGFFCFLEKPFSKELLIEKVNQATKYDLDDKSLGNL